MRRALLFALTAGMAVTAAAQAAPAPAADTVAQPFSSAITASGLKAYHKAISPDYMDGRKPGTIGAQRATAWIVEQMKAIGLEPGNHGSWFQSVPTVATTLEKPSQVKLEVREGGGTQAFDFGDEMVAVTL